MDQLPGSITVTIVLLTVFLIFVAALKYSSLSAFVRTRLMMTSLFVFIVATLTISFWPYTLATLPFALPACAVGIVVGYLFGVRAAEERLRLEGLMHYMEHFAHIHPKSGTTLTWWSLINFYTVMIALVLINLVGFSTVFYPDAVSLAVLTSAVGAFLLGTIAPYLIHLWAIKAPHKTSITTSDQRNEERA